MKKIIKRIFAAFLVITLVIGSSDITGQAADTDAEFRSLMITELLQNSATNNASDNDAYEYIEIYNNSDEAIDLNGYKIQYTYKATMPIIGTKYNKTDTLYTFSETTLLASRECLVIWIWHSGNEATIHTLDAFNQEYGTELTAQQVIVTGKATTMSNGENGTISIKKADNNEVDSVTYEASEYGTDNYRDPNEAITYWKSYSGSTFSTVTADISAAPTPGKVPTQFPGLANGKVISGTQEVIAYGDSLIIDGSDFSSVATDSTNGVGQIVFNARETDTFFKNAVAIGDDVLGIYNDGTYETEKTYAYNIRAEYFDGKKLTVEFHAGNKANVLEHDGENNDDFILRKIHLLLPSGKTVLPTSYQAKLATAGDEKLEHVAKTDYTVSSQSIWIPMGDSTSSEMCEILYVTFDLSDYDLDARRCDWDTTKVSDGEHVISNRMDKITVIVDNTAPVISTNMEEQKTYHNGTIEVSAIDSRSEVVTTTVTLNGKEIETPYTFRALEMLSGKHVLKITASDDMGNTAEKTVTFNTPKEAADIGGELFPENGSTVAESPTLSVTVTDESDDDMTVTFKKGERYQLEDTNIKKSTGNDGYPYEIFDIALEDDVNDNTVVSVKWSGASNNAKTHLYVYNVTTEAWEKMSAEQTVDGENMTLLGEVALKDHLSNGSIKVKVQNGEGYIPPQYAEGKAGANSNSNANDTPRKNYDFTFVVESDTQYYNEDYEGSSPYLDAKYEHQLNIHNWILNNRERMNIQYLFHDGDVIDDYQDMNQWQLADSAYKMLDDAGLPYGVLAGNHDVGHLAVDYTNYGTYFGESRFNSNPWYGGSYKNNRGHYDLITVGGIDFIMVYMGWEIGDAEIAWMNDVLGQYPERKAILNFHEYLLATGGLGEQPQRVLNEVVAVNENVCMIQSGHYHNAQTRVDTFTNADGSTRKVYSMLFDYQNMKEGGSGYIRLLHFDLDGEKIIVRTYSPSLNDYNAADGTISDASISGEEEFEISFADLGIKATAKELDTNGLDVNVYSDEIIGEVTNVKSGDTASCTWTEATNGIHGWYVEVTDEYGGFTRTNVNYVNVDRTLKIQYELRECEQDVIPVMDGFLFAGWYKNANEDNPIKNPVVGTTYYAKFVPDEVLGIKAQISSKLLKAETKDSSNASIRFVTTIDSTNYKEIGFNIQKGNGTPYDAAVSKYVYKVLYAVDATSENTGSALTEYEPTLFHGESEFFKTWTINKVPETAYNTEITIVPYWITLDGTRVEGTTGVKTINMGRSWIYVDNVVNADGKVYGTPDHPYGSIESAVSYANGFSEKAEQPKLILQNSMTMASTIYVTRSMEVANQANITITDGTGGTSNLVNILANAELTVTGENDTTITFDGADTDTKYGGTLFKVEENGTLNMKNVTMTGVNKNGWAGAISNFGTLNLTGGCVLSNNKATAAAAVYNAGIFNDNGSNYTNNTSTLNAGGAIRNEVSDGSQGAVVITGSTFHNNHHTTNDGGSIYSSGTKLELYDCSFSENTALNGGALYVNLSNISGAGNTFVGQNCTFTSNSVLENSTMGAGAVMFTGTGVAQLINTDVSEDGVYDYTNAFFTKNQCDVEEIYGGSIVVNSNATLYLTGYDFHDNSAKAGAAIFVQGTLIDNHSFYQNNIATKNAGGAIRNAGKASFTGSTFTGNKMADGVKNDGGAIYSEGKQFDLSNCVFDGNTAYRGGALYVNLTNIKNNNDDFTATNCIFRNNTVTTNTGFAAGAAQFTGVGVARLTNSAVLKDGSYDFTKALFDKNSTTGGGGAILVDTNATLHVTGYKFNKNTAAQGGAAIYNCCGTVYDSGSTYVENTSTSNTGAVRNYVDPNKVSDVAYFEKNGGSFDGNTASTAGGAVTNDSGCTFKMTGGVFENNKANNGGAIWQKGEMSLTDVTFDANSATTGGGAIYEVGNSQLAGCSFDGNKAKRGGAIQQFGTMILNTVNFTGNSATGTTTISGAELGDGGGAIWTQGTTTLTSCSFDKNVSGQYGGAVYAANTGADTTFEKCSFHANQANYGGVMLTTKTGLTDTTFKGCSFEGNYATATGGALYIWTYGKVTLQKADDGTVNTFTDNYSFNNNGSGHGKESTTQDYVLNGSKYFHTDISANKAGIYMIEDGAAEFDYQYK